MRETTKQWSSVQIYENIFPNESKVAVFKNVKTEEIIWVGETMPNQKILASYLLRNDSAKWNGVFLWFAVYCNELIDNTNTNGKVFLKALMLAIAENIAVTLMSRHGWSPLNLAVLFDGKDSILALIKRGANVNQQDNTGWTALHIAAGHGNMDACATLLDNGANIDTVALFGWTSLMFAAQYDKENVYEFLIEKGADQTRTNNYSKTAAQLANFQQR